MADRYAATAPFNKVAKREPPQSIAGAAAVAGARIMTLPLCDAPLCGATHPPSNVLALPLMHIGLTPVTKAQATTVAWQGKPNFVRHDLAFPLT
ncbi:hypothetical protein [Rhodopila sp.]|uniref:hypothetical protein n=1 Tax=Rhodopila sp. TaxID=2480087 RepID=UPI003D0BB952